MKKRVNINALTVEAKPEEDDTSRLVDLVLKPIFIFLRVNGYSVPTRCARRQFGVCSGVDDGPDVELNTPSAEKENKVTGTAEVGNHQKSTTKLCCRCRFVSVATKIHGIFVAILFAVNAVRYCSVFPSISGLEGLFVSAMVFQLFFVLLAVMYALSSRTVSRYLPTIIQQLQVYENCYGTALDCERFSKLATKRCRSFFWLQAIFSVAFVVAEQTFFPSLQVHLSPFDRVEGLGYYLVLGAFTVVLYFVGSVMFSLVGFFALMTIILHKEFSRVAEDLQGVLPKLNHRPKPCPQPPREESTRLGTREQERRCKPRARCCGFLKSSCMKCSSSVDDSPVFVQRRHVESLAMREDAGDISNYLPNSKRKPRKVCNTSGSLKTMSSTVCSETEANENHHHGLAETATHYESPDPDDVTGTDSARPSSNHSHKSQEEEFDILHRKHQALCELVDSTNKCVKHLVCMSFVCGIFLNCLIIYGLASGALDLANILFQVWNIVFSVFFIIMSTALGVVLNEKAHAPQDVIYAADWSTFSDRLLYKVQLFASRLGHTKIGYDVYGLFVIDKSTVLMILGTLLTYTIVVIQFQEGATTSCPAGDNSTVAG